MVGSASGSFHPERRQAARPQVCRLFHCSRYFSRRLVSIRRSHCPGRTAPGDPRPFFESGADDSCPRSHAFVYRRDRPGPFAARRLRRADDVPHGGEFRGQVTLLICYLAAAMISISSFIFRNDRLAMAGCATIGLIAVAYTLLHMGFSYFSQDRPSMPRRARPEWDKSAEELPLGSSH